MRDHGAVSEQNLMCQHHVPKSNPIPITVAQNIKFGTIEGLNNRKHPMFFQAFKNVRRISSKGGFNIATSHVDNESEAMRGNLLDLGIKLDVLSNDKHVP
jgi:hypothetical protein